MSDSSLLEDLKYVSASNLTPEEKKEAQKELIRRRLTAKKAPESTVTEKKKTPEKVPEAEEEQKPVLKGKTLSTGDCFYSSVYRAAREQNLLNKLKGCFKEIDTTEENAFIQSFRNIIAESDFLKEKLTAFYETTQAQLIANESYSEIYTEQLEAQPGWIQETFETLPESVEEFLSAFSEGVKTMTNWAGEFEVNSAVDLLNIVCDIQINTYNYSIVEAKEKEGEKDVINLLNEGEAHWVYYSFRVPKGFTETKQFKKIKKENCLKECKLITEKIVSAQKAIDNFGAQQEKRKASFEAEKDKMQKQKLQKEIEYEQVRYEENKRILPELMEQKRLCDAKCAMIGGFRGTRKNKKSGKKLTRKL
jgi:hypothetical protein